jgi:hypothetical protein
VGSTFYGRLKVGPEVTALAATVLLCSAGVYAQDKNHVSASKPELNLTGSWQSSHWGDARITQDGLQVTLTTKTNRDWHGTREGNQLELRHKLQYDETKSYYDPQVRKQLVGQEVIIRGRISPEDQRIDFKYFDLRARWEEKDGIFTVTDTFEDELNLTITYRRKAEAPPLPGTLTAEFINQDDPNNQTFETASGSTPVLYAGSKSIASDKLKLTAVAQTPSGVTVSRYTWSVSGAGAQSYETLPSRASNVWDVGSMKPTPAKLTFNCKMELSDGTTAAATKDFEIGIRTDDTLVVGWIDATLVALPTIDPDGHRVGDDILRKFPPNGIVTERPITLLTMGTLAGYFQGVAAPFLFDADRTYILDWLFKFAPNPPPPTAFTDEAAVSTFLGDGHRYKLFNRFQVKYRTDGTKFTAPPIILKNKTAIGVTRDPISRQLDFPGQSGPANNTVLNEDSAVSQINEGSPDADAVKAFNFLAGPYGQKLGAVEWNHIGSMITFGVAFGTKAKINMQLYPTYYHYTISDTPGELVYVKRFPQADEPIMNFTHPSYPNDRSLKLLFRRSN